jgi:hypothetical protein
MDNPWEKIQIPDNNVHSRRINSDHPLDLFWGRDQFGRYLFMYDFQYFQVRKQKFPDLFGIDIKLIKLDQDLEKGYMLILILKENKDWKIFRALCLDIISVTSNCEKTKNSLLIILKRLNKWHEFLKKNKSVLLTENKIKGILGELLFIKNHLEPAFGIDQAIKFWQGPEDNPQDFNVFNCGIEVKCQLGTTKPYVKINSAEQLCPQLPKMFLYVVTLGSSTKDSPDSYNLPFLINSFRAKLENVSFEHLERFNNLIFQTGYIDLEEYEEYSYIIANEEVYLVDESFPRICPDNLPFGISKLTYNVDLNDCISMSEIPDWRNIS